jgi:hypothetical protein
MKKKLLKFWYSLKTQLCKDSAFAAILILLIGYFASYNVVLLKIAVILSLLAMIFPEAFKPFAFVWFGIAKFLGLFVPKIVLSVIFFLLVVPVGMVRKLAGKDDMHLKALKKGTASVFTNRNHTYTLNDLKNPF